MTSRDPYPFHRPVDEAPSYFDWVARKARAAALATVALTALSGCIGRNPHLPTEAEIEAAVEPEWCVDLREEYPSQADMPCDQVGQLDLEERQL